MRKFVLLFILILIPLWVISYLIVGKGEVNMDQALDSALKEQLETNKISKKLIQSVDSLDLSNYNLTSAKGLEQFVNLKELNLSNNLLEDSSFLKDLKKLEYLNLSFNQFENIELSSSNIKKLNLRGNKVSKIEFVENLPNLKHLNLRD